ncbi:MAG TPA: hypothetical protein VNO43_04945 [Candidatus Eisenbacteria bacterium]|nr:hypothetical protein [Candidatus Eisenbacteria bacterium]
MTLALAMNGCIILPMPGHGGFGVISSEDMESLARGNTTRADVLLRFGDPAQRIDDDRIFVYSWSRIHAYAVPLVGPAPAEEIRRIHYLAMEFDPDNRLKRIKHFDPSLFHTGSGDLQAWIAAKDEGIPISDP